MTDKLPKISVLMSAYNAEKYIKEAISSILNQTFTDFELLVINDGSSDATEKEILSFTDRRIVYVKNETNLGLANSLNKGMKLAKGEYITRMDSDDISLPNRFELQVDFLDKHEDVALCSTAMKLFGAGNDRTVILKSDSEQIKFELIFGSAIGHASSMFRKQLFIDNNLFYNQDYFPAEDYELWTRAVFVLTMTNLPDVLYLYRMHETQVTKVDNRALLKCKKIQSDYLGRALNLPENELNFFVDDFINSTSINIEKIKEYKKILCLIFQANAKTKFFGKKFKKTLHRVFQNKLYTSLRSYSKKFLVKHLSLLFKLRLIQQIRLIFK
ncbi:MAG: glycosyltransferase family 2 protein [Prevotellaceae bacterium]|jgi:glycosyltransferase involved in cell wall biosynthesis|nr:glycosyltransferase family 2 protein [Prevotellaceae bacterium]